MERTFEMYIKRAIEFINERALEEAEEIIKQAMMLKAESPEPHNLLGILAEYRGDISLACKHFRAAWALDETYKPAYNNLNRLTGTYDSRSWHKFDFGMDKMNQERGSEYLVDYDSDGIGHIKKV